MVEGKGTYLGVKGKEGRSVLPSKSEPMGEEEEVRGAEAERKRIIDRKRDFSKRESPVLGVCNETPSLERDYRKRGFSNKQARLIIKGSLGGLGRVVYFGGKAPDGSGDRKI